MSSSHAHILKVIVLGDSTVGKTSLINRYATQEYSQHYKPTIGADFSTKEVVVDNTVVRLQIWDTAGQERYRCLGAAFYRGADCCMLVYDITSVKSFDSMEDWRKEMLEYGNLGNETFFPFAVVGNKVDQETKRQVLLSTAQEWAHGHGDFPLIECSAKDSLNVQEAFQALVRLTLSQKKDTRLIPYSVDPIPGKRPPHKRKCC